MANDNKKKNVGELIREEKRRTQARLVEFQDECDHKNRTGPRISSIHSDDLGIYVKDRHKYDPNTVICQDCTDIWSMTAYNRKDVDEAFFVINSIINQIKLLADLSDVEKEELAETRQNIRAIQNSVVRYYFEMLKQLEGGERKKNNNQHQKGRVGNIGGMGVSARSFR